ncbi:MAG: gliding motility-associated ABC transporter ATP-binding subunit GldA [Bacteroidetes bacterium GWF2_42_66]|nr:MAG: gliding motility-associated ABC transporter ATP-binding subunit GldA [Bacteroidetes bacterium GWA2_42_15]OFX98994.1 MAG: gliding motility-associated ABC transporter ATP-binding subunit GldA [Bacteroidetes bacterium GWE2_42_39]OFY46063.1 MAG: gliding motility-associated ABC transporter ATP-binding subunit GldA [Bacteroidetes bacterium GWF2_42_66]HBL77202.1 gliding motility-associated ABC transporter ATP-binding subunit GldA [Prolixibacteraceae bacterium]HCU63768.1 gliding motility-associ
MDIVVDKITKTYGLQKAVDELSFRVKTGEVLGFLGPNGAGKTTTMKAITCFLNPNEGNILVGGMSVTENPEEVKKHIGYLPENNPLYQDMPVIDYLRFSAELQGVPKEKVRERIIEMVKVCGLKAEKHKKIRELSKGFRQRVGLAQALIHDPEVLILDEPTTGLDPNQIVEIRELIKKIGKEKTVILSSHILAEVEATCDRILIISKGKIVADGTPEELRKQAQGNEILKVQIRNGERNEMYSALKSLPTVALVDFIDGTPNCYEVQSKKDENSAKAIFDLCVKKGWYISQLTPVETKLEDVFREVTMN